MCKLKHQKRKEDVFIAKDLHFCLPIPEIYTALLTLCMSGWQSMTPDSSPTSWDWTVKVTGLVF